MLKCFLPKNNLLSQKCISDLFQGVNILFIEHDPKFPEIPNVFDLADVLEYRMKQILSKHTEESQILLFDYSLNILRLNCSPGATVSQQAEIMGLRQFAETYQGYDVGVEFRILYHDGKKTHEYTNIMFGTINSNWISDCQPFITNWLLTFTPRDNWLNSPFIDISEQERLRYHTAFYIMIKNQTKLFARKIKKYKIIFFPNLVPKNKTIFKFSNKLKINFIKFNKIKLLNKYYTTYINTVHDEAIENMEKILNY